jgi:hypothetical protein
MADSIYFSFREYKGLGVKRMANGQAEFEYCLISPKTAKFAAGAR